MAFTYFFRDLQTLEVAVSHVVPYTTGRSHIRVWDAGCAMGQEAYTLAMRFAENMGGFAFKNLHIHATDIDECNLFGATIRSGLYRESEDRTVRRGVRTILRGDSNECGRDNGNHPVPDLQAR